MTTAHSWKEVSVGKHATLLNGFAFPSEGFTDNGGMPLIRIRDLRNQTTEVNYHGRFDTKYVVRRGDLLIGMDGDFDTVKWKGSDALLNQRVCKLETKDPKELVQDFLFYRIIDEVIRINRITAATTVKHLSSGDVLGIRFDRPPEPEQSKIAEILSKVGRAIEQTEALIAKQQRIKTGLMQDLLTRGIDEQGNLRSEETHQFKDSPLGRIPVEWDVTELADVLAEMPRNGIYKPANQIGFGTVLIGQTSFTKERRLDYRLARRAIVSPNELRAYQLRNHDILVTRVFATVDGVGLPVLVTDLPEAAVYESNMLRLRVDSAKSNPTLLFNWLRSHAIRNRVAASVNASNQTSINQTVLNALPVLVIPIDEQNDIVAAISAQETYLIDLARKLGKLRALKTALMQDLLTGEKRVTPLLEPAVTT